MSYGHALLLASRCAHGCRRIAVCISEEDPNKTLCGHCGATEYMRLHPIPTHPPTKALAVREPDPQVKKV